MERTAVYRITIYEEQITIGANLKAETARVDTAEKPRSILIQ